MAAPISLHHKYIWAVFLWLLLFPTTLGGNRKAGLYEAEDDVVILVADNFYQTVLLSNKAWMVEFYSSWCGHCVNFAPTWKKFATDVKAWRSVIAVAAIDCADKINHGICTAEEISGYPSMKEFPPHAKNGSGVLYKGKRDVTSLREELVRYVLSQPKLPIWPSLQLANATDVINLHSHVQGFDPPAVFVIFEAKESVLGAEVILDMSEIGDLDKQILRVVDPNKTLREKWSVPQQPSVYVWTANGKPTALIAESPTREGLSKAIRDYYFKNKKVTEKDEKKQENVDKDVAGADQKEGETNTESTNQINKVANQTRRFAYLADMESALHYSLRIEVSSRKVLKGEELTALRHYMSVLNKYFPARAPVGEFLSNIDQKLQGASWVDGIPIATWLTLVDSEKTAGWLPVEQNWIGCKGSSKYYRGYPCSLWTLFHTLTVMQAEIDKNNLKSNSLEVLRAMREYITNFFGCVECSENFEKESSNIVAEVTDLDSAILWLWRTHNRVNKRLAGDETDDPAFPKQQFPPSSLCPLCRDPVDGSWNEHEVLAYLKSRYGTVGLNVTGIVPLARPGELGPRPVHRRGLGPQNVQAELMSRVKQRKYSAEAVGPPKNFSVLGVTVFDISICLVLNLLCVGLVLVVYFVFFRRRKLKALQSCFP